MAKKICSRRELLDRWRGIQEEEEDDSVWSNSSKQNRIRQLKEEWFSDTFNFLIYLQKDTHIWCGSWDLMGPLLETFYNFFKDDRDDSPLKILWRRISQEMRQCTQCICQHHQAQELYTAEYESSCIDPLLNVLRSLDEERVTQHLKAINVKIGKGELDSELYSAEVVSVMFEVLMFPVLLDDQSLVNEFQIFIEAIDDTHELTLAGHQQYSGVYALLFFKSRRVRSIGLRLAAYNGKLRRAGDLEPLQPLLKKCIGYLETEVLPSSLETSRPRVQLERINVWVGIKALLGFLEPPAFEDGILERHPTFLSIVLNHVSDDSLEFSYAVNCLRLLFEMLGCKLWLRTTLSPSVMRNTLLGQCFHTRNEKSHKEIFDLFQPFLQSLEALQDGEHEKQRRHFLYFLLHQVKMSSNFSVLMRKKACQIALLIIHRGYKMNPPCPPYECAHMWGPSLICSLRDSSLHDSLRRPAFDLIHTIIVSDSGALVTSLLRHRKHGKVDNSISADFNDEEDELVFSHDVEEKDCSCWSEFSVQSKLSAREYIGWICIPMLWLDVLVETDLLVFPISFFKAVLWALSRFSMVELENSMEMELSVRDWLSSHAGQISFVWEVPTGSDDGGDGKVSKNSIEASSMSTVLVKTFKRLTAHFVNHMGHRELWKQLTWEPRMAESLILLLVDPNDKLRQVNRLILEHVSNTRGLANGLQFLCSSGSSLSTTYLGLRHALRLLQLDCVLSNFHKLHHFFFVLSKLLKEMVASSQKTLGSQVHSSNLSSQGGFLRQPVFDASVIDLTDSPSVVDLKSWEQFNQSLSEFSWPSLSKCLTEGKGFINNRGSQMTCIRVLEILPVVFERLCSSFQKLSGTGTSAFELRWLHDLVDWGKSSNATIARYWKQSLAAVLDILKIICPHDADSIVRATQTLLSCDDLEVDELNEQVSRLSVSLISQVGTSTSKVGHTILEPFDKKCLAVDTEPSSFGDVEVQVLGSPVVKNKSKDKVIVLSDDEAEEKLSEDMTGILHNKTSDCCLNEIALDPVAVKSIYANDNVNKSDSSIRNSKNISDAIQSVPITQNADLFSKKHGSDALKDQRASAYPAQSKGVDGTKKESKNLKDVLLPKNENQSLQKGSSDVTACSKILSQPCSLGTLGTSTSLGTKDAFLKELEHNDENDPWEAALKAARCRQSLSARPGPSGSKRQVIQLNMPGENKSGFRRYDVGGKRLKPPRLDDWYRPILEMDYFSAVGLSSTNEDENATAAKLKEVPVCFESPDHYVDIFRPLVLEEFKAQLHSSFIEASSSEEMSCGSVSLLSVERVDDFHLVRCVPSDNESASSRGCSENDLILLTKNPFQNSTHDVHMVGKVERREKDNKRRLSILVIRFYLQNGSSRLNKAKRFLLERSKWYINRIMSIIPQLREFQALSSLKDIPILPIILDPSICPVSDYECNKVELGKLSRPLQHAFKSSFNDSQLKAISIAIGTHGPRRDFELSLIQGPPGTGKTRTILAIVSGLLAFPSQRMSNVDKQPPCSLRTSNTSSSNLRPQTSQSVAIARAWQDAAFARQLNENGENNSKFMGTSMRVRVLICAQSNAAVDELVSRISVEGLYGSDGELYKPYLVRVGNAKTVHPNSLSFFIDTLVDQRLEEEKMNECDARNDSTGENSTVLRSNLEQVVDRIRSYEAKHAYIRDGNPDSKSLLESGASKDDDVKNISAAEIGAKLNKLYQQKREICKDLAFAQARERKTSEEMKELKNKLRKTILREAEIVVTTLSGCGGDLFGVCSESLSAHKFGSSSEQTLFDAVVIDEAAQALEPATLIPLQLLKSNHTKCIMVGDPKQLPATVLSHVASKFLFECSMFERLQRAGHPVVMLSKQYRMHPEICKFPSLHFYDDKLLNGDQMSSKVAPFHENKYLGPYMFFDVVDGQESHGKSSGAMSLYNECEASVAVEILKFFSKRYPSEFVGGRIGIISPYKSQVSLLRSRFSSVFGPSATSDVEFNTVDGFQGREVDILILSTVRASDLSSSTAAKSSIIGFVADVRRMNVALTRAKLSLWILGNAKTLRTNQNWAALIKNAKERNVVKTMARPYESMFKKYTSASRTQASLAGSDSNNHVKLDEKAKGTSECLDQTKGSIEGANEIKTKILHSEGGQHECRPKGDGKLKKSMNKSVRHNGLSEDVDPSLKMNHVPDDRGKGKEIVRKHANMSSTAVHVGKGKVIFENSGTQTKLARVEQEVDINKRVKNDHMLKQTGDSSECDMGQSKSGIALSCTESNRQGQELNDGCKTTNMPDTPKDLVIRRKRQRDAVDALLPSAFIPSKKPEATTKSKSTKRPHSPTPNEIVSTKPPKPRKDPSTTSTNLLQDSSITSAHQQAHLPNKTKKVSKHRDLVSE